MNAPSSDEEFRKRLTSVLMDGPTVVTIDNVENKLAAPSRDSVLTAHNRHDRMLGSTSMVTLPQWATWIATGNNIKLGGDMPAAATGSGSAPNLQGRGSAQPRASATPICSGGSASTGAKCCRVYSP